MPLVTAKPFPNKSMNNTQPESSATEAPVAQKKPGFFGRILEKVDNSMKHKAALKAEQGCCCKNKDESGDQCC